MVSVHFATHLLCIVGLCWELSANPISNTIMLIALAVTPASMAASMAAVALEAVASEAKYLPMYLPMSSPQVMLANKVPEQFYIYAIYMSSMLLTTDHIITIILITTRSRSAATAAFSKPNNIQI